LGILVWCGAAFGAKHQTWVEVQTPNFIIVSNAGDKNAIKSAVQFEQIRALFRQSLTFASQAHTPQITVLAVKNEDSMRQLLPEYWAKGHAHLAGIFFSRLDQFYAAVQLDAPGDNPYEAFYHEYYHSLSLPYFPGMPLWLAEGLAEFYSNTHISGDKAYMGEPSAALLEELQEKGFIPLDLLFRVDHSSPYYNEQNRTSKFYAESWALTHYLFLGDKGAHRKLLFNYLDAFDHGATPEQAIKAFGDLADLQRALQNYIDRVAFSELIAPAPPKIAASEFVVKELSDAEVDAEIGGFEAVRGNLEQAMPFLQEAVRLDPKLALGYQNLALAEFFQGQRDEALSSVSQAIALDPKNGVTRFLRAYLRATHGGFGAHDDQMEEDLRQAIAANPDSAPPSALLAMYLSTNQDSLPEALTLAKRAVTLEPGTAAFQLDLGQVLLRMHRYDEAKAAILSARNETTVATERAQADQLLNLVDQVRAADEGLVSAPHSDDSEASAPRGRSDSEPQSGPPETGASVDSSAQEVTGIVKQMSCGNGIQMLLEATDGTYRLQVPPGQPMQYELHSKPQPGFNPCTSIKGMHVKARYHPDDSKGKTGTLEILEILGP
jgi:tetratricopeptide (TPR) repeat protein